MKNILGTKFPIIQGGMANIATAQLAAAVSNAGGLGLIGAGGMTPEVFAEQIDLCRTLTTKPFGVNIMLMHPQVDELAQIALDKNVSVITTGAGSPAKYMPMWKQAGITVIPVIASVAMAMRVQSQGADAVVAEGCEAGGHIGELTTMALVPQVVSAVNIPVFAAGGIANANGFAAAMALGASGVQLGTVLLASEECPIHQNYKQAVVDAKDIDTCVTGRIVGGAVRVLKNRMAREYLKMESQNIDKMELEKLTLGSLRRAVVDGDTKTGSLMAGQSAGMVKEIKPVKQILEDIYFGGIQLLKTLPTTLEV